MSGLATLFKKLGAEHGVEIDADDLEAIGLSDDDSTSLLASADVDEQLSGEAAGAVEIFLSEPRTWLKVEPQTEGEGFWEPIIREGQWAMRPSPTGGKVRRPLKVVPGKSSDQRKEIGLADIVEAFDHPAIEHVTVPTSHDNLVTQNTGFIRKLKVVDGKYKPKGKKAEVKVKVLMGLYDIKLPDVKEKIDLGAIASRSAGLLYDYTDTEEGRTWPVVLEHVALTNKPWVTGMAAFGRKLKSKVKSTVGLSLTDEEPEAEDLLAQEGALESIELADTSITWDKSDDPDWLRSQVNKQLEEAREKKALAIKSNLPAGAYVSYDYPARYRCAKARPGLALISDGWGDDCNFWTAPFKVVEGEVELETDFEKWTPSKRVWIPDADRSKTFEPGEEPLKDAAPVEPAVLSPLQLAQVARRRRSGAPPPPPDPIPGAKNIGRPTSQQTTIHPRGGEQHMAGSATELQLSDEARAVIDGLKKDLETANARADKFGEQIERLAGPVRNAAVDGYISELKAMGLDEAHGFSGVLVEVRDLMLADDGEPAVASDKFADGANEKGTLSLSEALKRVFGAFKKGEDGRVALGAQLAQPTEKPGEALGDDGKPLATDEAPKEKPFDQLSDEEKDIALARDNPAMARVLGVDPEKLKAAQAAATNGGKAAE